MSVPARRTEDVVPLTAADRRRRDRLASVIDRALRLHLKAAQALLEIRDSRLYRETHGTFAAYVADRWSMTRTHGDRLCQWAEVAQNLTPTGVTPLLESHARPLATLPAEQQIAAWSEVIATGPVTATAIERACSDLRRNEARQRVPKATRGAAAENVLCADVLDGIAMLDDGSVGLVVTSPPYADQRRGHYSSVPEGEYPAWFAGVMSKLRPKMTRDGSVLVVIRSHVRDGQVSDYVMRTRLAVRDASWCECEELIWYKPDGPPLASLHRPRRAWENILWFSPGRRPFVDLTACGRPTPSKGFEGRGRYGSNGKAIIEFSAGVDPGTARVSDVVVAHVGENERGVDHVAVFPPTLADQLILTYSRPGDLVLDPFCGSGTTLLGAQRNGRPWWGIDDDPDSVRLARGRLRSASKS
jgi:site-specific DNA-methyltransferase (adenine-specific)